MATIQLGKIKQVWRGTWSSSPNPAYSVDDLVEYTDSGVTSTYIAVSTPGSQVPSSGGSVQSNWNLVAKGVADPIPTQSGNAGKFLKTNGSSLSFDSAGGWVKIAGGTGPSSAVTQIAIDNIFSADYKFYKVFIQWIQDDWSKIRFIDTSGNDLTSGSYTWGAVAIHENTDGGPDRVGYNGVTYIPGQFWNSTDGRFSLTELTFVDPYSSSSYPGCSVLAHVTENSQLHSQHGAGYWAGQTGIRGFKFSGDAGDGITDANFQYVVLGAKI